MNLEVNQQQMNLIRSSYDVFNEWGSEYINSNRVFFFYFGQIPSRIYVRRVEVHIFTKALEKEKKDEIEAVHSIQEMPFANNELKSIGVVYIMKDGTVLNCGDQHVAIIFKNENKSIAEKWVEFAKKKRSNISNYKGIFLVTSCVEGLNATPIQMQKIKLKLSDNYNDDLVEVNKELIRKLKKNNTSGLYLFHGVPGTGKSTYIKYLVHQLKQDIIFMSPKLAGNLDTPDLTTFLIENRNSIIIIEDAEDLITAREGERNSSISTLLNLTDGLLGETLHIKVIATFNTEAKNIDKALMRKGRLELMYQFKPLSIEKSNKLFTKLKIDYITNKEMSLTDIYNFKNKDYHYKPERGSIGFGR